MIDKDKIKIGDTCIYAVWSISWSGCRVTCLPKPEKVKITGITKERPFQDILIKNGKNEETYINSANLYETEENMKEEFNRTIHDKMDRITSQYESDMKYLKSKLYD